MQLKSLLLSFFVGVACSLSAQDIHYSLFTMTPTMLNPATTGAFEGSIRVGGIYRDQWGFLEYGYKTPMFNADAPLFMVGKRDWIGAGATVYQDKAGTLGLSNGAFLLAVSYHHAMDKKSRNIVSFGVQGGSVQRGLDDMLGTYTPNSPNTGRVPILPSDLNGFPISGYQPMSGQMESAFDLNAGVILTSRPDKKTVFQGGVAAHHILSPNYSLVSPNAGSGGGGGGNNPNAAKLPVRLTAHANFKRQINKTWSINPTLLAMAINNQNQVSVQTWAGYTINPDKDLELQFGLGYRLGRDGEALLGVQSGDLKVAASFDLALSQFQNIDGTQSAFEVGASYIIKIYKTPDLPPVLVCPQL